MKIIIEMPEPRKPECELCGMIHKPKEVCEEELEGFYMEPSWKKDPDALMEEINENN